MDRHPIFTSFGGSPPFTPRVRSHVTVSGDKCSSSAISFSERPFSLYSRALFAIAFTSFIRSLAPTRAMPHAGYQGIALGSMPSSRASFERRLRRLPQLLHLALEQLADVLHREGFGGHRRRALRLVDGPRSDRNSASALVPSVPAELFRLGELVSGEDRAVPADELVVEGAGVADADAALHVPFEARLHREAYLPRQIDDRGHHLLRAARDDLGERLAGQELLGEGRDEPGGAAGPVVRRDVDLPGGVRPLD